MNNTARERLISHGAHTLANADLLALLLRTGNPQHSAQHVATLLLSQVNGLHELATMSTEELMQIPGIGLAKATSVVAACEIARRLQATPKAHRASLNNSALCYEQYRGHLQHRATEHFMVVALDAKSRPLRHAILSTGERLHTTVSPRKLFACAISCAAASVLILHNHPSGDPQPSTNDCHITALLAETGRLLDIPLLDHIIVGDDDYYSFRDDAFFDTD